MATIAFGATVQGFCGKGPLQTKGEVLSLLSQARMRSIGGSLPSLVSMSLQHDSFYCENIWPCR